MYSMLVIIDINLKNFNNRQTTVLVNFSIHIRIFESIFRIRNAKKLLKPSRKNCLIKHLRIHILQF